MTTKEVAQICGVTEKTVRENAKTFGKVFENGKSTEWTEDELKKVQLVLMGNQVKQGTQTDIVKSNLESAFQVGLVAKACLDSPEAWEQFKQLGDSLVEQKLQAKQLEEQNKLLLEQKEQAEAETARIYQYNKNFHSNLYTASDIAKKFGITPNMVGRIANENGLKQDPIYGKLGKIQLNNGKWVNQFYYNEDALTVIKSMVMKCANIIK